MSEAEFMETNGLIRTSETGDGHVHSKERSAKNKTGLKAGGTGGRGAEWGAYAICCKYPDDNITENSSLAIYVLA